MEVCRLLLSCGRKKGKTIVSEGERRLPHLPYAREERLLQLRDVLEVHGDAVRTERQTEWDLNCSSCSHTVFSTLVASSPRVCPQRRHASECPFLLLAPLVPLAMMLTSSHWDLNSVCGLGRDRSTCRAMRSMCVLVCSNATGN